MKNKSLTQHIQNALLHLHVNPIKQAVLHNALVGQTDMPAHGIVHLPFKNHRLKDGALDLLNRKLHSYDVRVDAYKLAVRGKIIERIAITHIDRAAVRPSPAYQGSLQMR